MRRSNAVLCVVGVVTLVAAVGCDDELIARLPAAGAAGAEGSSDAGETAIGGAVPSTGGAATGGAVPSTGGTATGGAVPSTGGTATGGGAESCAAADPELADRDAADLFAYPHVPGFDFYLPPADWAALQANAAAEEYVEADACFEGRGLGRVGLRFKGSYGSLYECADQVGVGTCRKLSLKVKFNEYVAEQRFYGLKRLNFNANRFDDSRIKERLAYDLFRAAGIIAPRAAWAVVRVNGESQGLYGMVEAVDGRFTADRWPDNPDANLYKELWPTSTDPAYVAAHLKTNEETADVAAAIAFAAAMGGASEDELRGTLGDYTDLEALARFLAVEDALASYDGITYFWTDGTSSGNHNYYFYEEAPDRFTLIPWDVESTFWINPDHAAPHWTVIPDDCSLTYEYWGGFAFAPACDRVIRAMAQDPSDWQAAARELLDGPFAEATMLDAINEHADFVRAEAEADPTPPSYGSFESAVSTLRTSIPALRSRLEQLIAEP
jgi:spore coat protein H